MIHKVVGVLEYRIRGREKLDEVADSISNTDRDDPEHEKGHQQSIWARQLESICICNEDSGSYKATENYELLKSVNYWPLSYSPPQAILSSVIRTRIW